MSNDGSEFTINQFVPADIPQVHEYVLPEPDIVEQKLTAEYELDAKLLSMKLLVRQYKRWRKELDRAIDDLEARLHQCDD